jgi:membrane protease YdiL (CAAX protease family)
MRLVYWRSKAAGVPAILRGANVALSLRAAIAAAIASAAGIAYMASAHTLWPEIAKAASGGGSRGWMLALAVVAAPLCEEFIFRGLIFGGLRRSMSALPAMVMSAAIFAVVHPPLSMLPYSCWACAPHGPMSAAKPCWRPCWSTRSTTPSFWASSFGNHLDLEIKTGKPVTPTAVIFGYGALPQNSGTTAQMRSKRL